MDAMIYTEIVFRFLKLIFSVSILKVALFLFCDLQMTRD